MHSVLRQTPSPGTGEPDVVLYRSSPTQLRTASATSASSPIKSTASRLFALGQDYKDFVPSHFVNVMTARPARTYLSNVVNHDDPATPEDVQDAYAELSFTSSSSAQDTFNASAVSVTPSLTYSTASSDTSPRGSDDLSALLARVTLHDMSSGGSTTSSGTDDASSTVKGADDRDETDDSDGTLTMRGNEHGFPLLPTYTMWQPPPPYNPGAGVLGFASPHMAGQPVAPMHGAFGMNMLAGHGGFTDALPAQPAYPGYSYPPAPTFVPAPPPRPPQQQPAQTTWLDESLRQFHSRYAANAPPAAVQSAVAFITSMTTQFGNPPINPLIPYQPRPDPWTGRPMGPPVTPEHAAMLGGLAIPHIGNYVQGAEGPLVNSPAPNNRKAGLYKTEMCHNFVERGNCRYGDKCQFAHGDDELRAVVRHPKWKTELCRTWFYDGSCPYANRCVFIHPDGTPQGMGPHAIGLLGGMIDPAKLLAARTRSTSESGKSLLQRIKEPRATSPEQATTSTPAAGTPTTGLPTPKTSPSLSKPSAPVFTKASPPLSTHTGSSPSTPTPLPPVPSLRLNTSLPSSFSAGPQTAPATRPPQALALSPTMARKPTMLGGYVQGGGGGGVQSPTRPSAHSRGASYSEHGGLTLSTAGPGMPGPASAAVGGSGGMNWFGAPAGPQGMRKPSAGW